MTVDHRQDRLVVVGVILGAHGVRGAVRIKSFTQMPEDCLAYGPLLSEEGEVLMEPVSVTPGKAHLIVTPKVLQQKEQLDAMKGVRLFVPRGAMPENEDEDDFYIEDLIGLTVRDGKGVPCGQVKAVHDFGAGDIVEVATGQATVMVPFTREDVPIVDLAAGWIEVTSLSLWSDDAHGQRPMKGPP